MPDFKNYLEREIDTLEAQSGASVLFMALVEVGTSADNFGASGPLPLPNGDISPGNCPVGSAMTPLQTLAAGGHLRPALYLPTFASGTLELQVSGPGADCFAEFDVWNAAGTEKLSLAYSGSTVSFTSGQTWEPDLTSDWNQIEKVGTDLDLDAGDGIVSSAGGQFYGWFLIGLKATDLA